VSVWFFEIKLNNFFFIIPVIRVVGGYRLGIMNKKKKKEIGAVSKALVVLSTCFSLHYSNDVVVSFHLLPHFEDCSAGVVPK